jgi:hypothetical protein
MGPEPAISARRRVAALLITLVLFTGLGLLMLELGLRLFVPLTDRYVYLYDPILGPRSAPNQTGEFRRLSYVHGGFRFNNRGWNHPDDYVIPKPSGGRRVCVVGDSQVESLQVQPEETFYALAQRAMSRPDRPVQWYAFGNSGWGTNMQYETIRHYALDYKPDLVILLFVQNDPYDTSPYLMEQGNYRPLYYLDEQEQLTMIPPVYYERPFYRPRVFTRLALYRYFVGQKQLYTRLLNFMHHGQLAIPGGLPIMVDSEAARHEAIPGIDQLSRREREARTWQLIEALLRAARDESRMHGAEFAIVFRGWAQEIDSPLTGKTSPVPPREEDPYALGTRSSEMGREQLAPIADRLGVPYLDLTDALRDEVSKQQKSHMFPDDIHYNAMAHARVGAELATWVEGLLGSQPPLRAAEARRSE